MWLVCVCVFVFKKDTSCRFGFCLTSLFADFFCLFHWRFSYNTNPFFIIKVLTMPSVSNTHLKCNFLVWLMVLQKCHLPGRWHPAALALPTCVCVALLVPAPLICRNLVGVSRRCPRAVGNSAQRQGKSREWRRLRQRRRGTPGSAGGELIPPWFNDI